MKRNITESYETRIKKQFNITPGTMEVKSIPFSIVKMKSIYTKENSEEVFRFEGYASTNSLDRGNDIVASGAFKSTIERKIAQNNRAVRMKYQHNSLDTIGKFPIEYMKEDGKGLFCVGEICLGVQRGREVKALMEMKCLTDLSIGFSVIDFKMEGNNRIITDLELWEISVVDEPMNPEAEVTSLKAEKNRHGKKMTKSIKSDVSSSKITVPELKIALGNIRLAERMLKSTAVFSDNGTKYLGRLLHEAYKSNAANLDEEEFEEEKEIDDELTFEVDESQESSKESEYDESYEDPDMDKGFDEDMDKGCDEDMKECDEKEDDLDDENMEEQENAKAVEQLERVLKEARKLF